MVKFNKEGINNLQEKIDNEKFKNSFKLKQTDFTRNRKMNFKDVICYITRVLQMINLKTITFPCIYRDL